MSLLRSFSAALSGAARGFRFWASQTVASGSWGGAIRWLLSPTDPRRRAGTLYENGIVSIGLQWYWRNLTYPRLRVMRARTSDGETLWEEVLDHPLPKALEDGPHYDHTTLWHGTLISWMVAGNAYWYKIRSASGLVVGYAYVPHFLVRPMADRDNPDGTRLTTYYEYALPGASPVALAPEDVVHLRAGVDPRDLQSGLAPLAGVLAEIGTDNLGTTLTAALMANAGIPGLVISPKQSGNLPGQTPEQIEAFKAKWRSQTTGEMAGTPNVLPFPADVSVLGFSPDQLALDKTTRMQVSRVCAALGLDPMVLGLPSDSKTYSNYGEAIEAAYEGALMPLLNIWALQLRRQTLGDYPASRPGDRIGWDTSEVRALQEDEDARNVRWLARWEKNLVDRASAKRGVGLRAKPEDEGVYFADTQVKAAPVGPAARSYLDGLRAARLEIERAA